MFRLSYCLAAGATAIALAACSPSHDWRTVRTGPTESLFPCKPITAARAVPLAGQTRTMTLSACAVDEVTFAVAWVGTSSAADATAVAQALAQAQAAQLQAGAATRATVGTSLVKGSSTTQVSPSKEPNGPAAAVQASVVGAPERWARAQRDGHVEQFLSGVRVGVARP